MSDVTYSKIRDRIIQGLSSPMPVPIQFTDKETHFKDVIKSVGLENLLFTKVLGFDDKLYLSKALETLEDTTGKIKTNFNLSKELISWMLWKGIVDSSGDHIFYEKDTLVISGQFDQLMFFLCWQVLDTNGFTTVSAQAIVGNSDGTQPPTP